MKIDLAALLREVGLPIGLVALFAAVLGLFGVELDRIIAIGEGLVGTFALIALLINVLKYVGAIDDGMAGKLSAWLNLALLAAVSVIFKLYPSFDFGSIDQALGEFARVAAIVFAYIVQVVGTKHIHLAMTRGLGLKLFSHSMRNQAYLRAV
jgi:hypothetical protein